MMIASRYLAASAIGAYAVAVHVATLPMQKLMSVVNQVASSTVARLQDDPVRLREWLMVAFRVASLVSVLFLSVQIGSLVDATAARYLGREATVGSSFRAGLRVAPKIIGTGLLLFFSLLVGWAVLIVAIVLSNNALVAALAVLAGLVATVFVFASWLVAPVVAAVEPVGPIHAVRRSWWLSNGHRWRILGLQILLAVLQTVLSTLISFIFVAAFISDAVVRIVLQNIVNVIATILWAPVEWGTFTILYFDLRVRKEALDLQLAAEALPRQA